MVVKIPVPAADRASIEEFVDLHLGHLVDGSAMGSPSIRGGQRAANLALQTFCVRGYSRNRNEVFPVERRAASRLSPYIRHGLLQLREVWDAVEGGPERDVGKFRDELLWQEYARHWYASLGEQTKSALRQQPIDLRTGSGWDRTLSCLDEAVTELETHGWIVNQTRMWLASDWSVRNKQVWTEGEDLFFKHLLDGSRAANRLGWQWTSGVGSSRPYGFSRWQVEKRAPGLCEKCAYQKRCPLEERPTLSGFKSLSPPKNLELFGPTSVRDEGVPKAVWLTAESLGDQDPALSAYPDLPVIFVFDEPLLAKLRLTSKRYVFILEALAEMAQIRSVEIRLGSPSVELEGLPLAVTHAPVPGFQKHAERLKPVRTHPWPWLCHPVLGSVRSFSAWSRKVHQP